MGTRRMEHKDAYDQDKIPFYYSRPDLRPPRLNVAVRDPERATPGLLFVAPFFSGDYQPDSGPYIFDTNGVRFSKSNVSFYQCLTGVFD